MEALCIKWLIFKKKMKTDRPTSKQQLKVATVKAWESISGEETRNFMMAKDFHPRIEIYGYITIMLVLATENVK